MQEGKEEDTLRDITNPFSEEEIKEAVWQLGADKSSGPNVFPIFFYRTFWNIIKPEVCGLLEGLHDGTLQIKRINYAHVVLVLKKGDALKVGDFWLISVLNASVKIISKILANRFRDTIRDRIEDQRFGFLKGRLKYH